MFALILVNTIHKPAVQYNNIANLNSQKLYWNINNQNNYILYIDCFISVQPEHLFLKFYHNIEIIYLDDENTIIFLNFLEAIPIPTFQ